MSQSPEHPEMPSEKLYLENSTNEAHNSPAVNLEAAKSDLEDGHEEDSLNNEDSEGCEQNWWSPNPSQSLSPPSPSPPLRWRWQCHMCSHTQTLGVSNRCIDCGHRYCSGNPNSNNPRLRKSCASEFDYAGWGHIITQKQRDCPAPRVRRDGFTGCWNSCLYPGHCRRYFLPTAARSALRNGHPHYLALLPERNPGFGETSNTPIETAREESPSKDQQLERQRREEVKRQKSVRMMEAIENSALSAHNRAGTNARASETATNLNATPPSRATPTPDTGMDRKQKELKTQSTSRHPKKRRKTLLLSNQEPQQAPSNGDAETPREYFPEPTDEPSAKRQRCHSEPPLSLPSTSVQSDDDTTARRTSTPGPESRPEGRHGGLRTRLARAVSVVREVASDARSRLTGSSPEPKKEDENRTATTSNSLERQDTPIPETVKPGPSSVGRSSTLRDSMLPQTREPIPPTSHPREEIPVSGMQSPAPGSSDLTDSGTRKKRKSPETESSEDDARDTKRRRR